MRWLALALCVRVEYAVTDPPTNVTLVWRNASGPLEDWTVTYPSARRLAPRNATPSTRQDAPPSVSSLM